MLQGYAVRYSRVGSAGVLPVTSTCQLEIDPNEWILPGLGVSHAVPISVTFVNSGPRGAHVHHAMGKFNCGHASLLKH